MPAIVVADDHPLMRLLARRSLEDAGYEVIEATDGRDALKLVSLHHPAAVLLDWQMPELTGPAVCRRLRSDPAFAATPVVIMTGHGEESFKQAAREAGASDCLVKPVEPSALLACVEQLLQVTVA
jgi:CheY-like chemotaxis protein